MASWPSNWSADMPFEWVAMRCAAQKHTVSGNLDRCITFDDRSRGIRKCAPGSSAMPRVRCHRRGKQNPLASVAQTEMPRSRLVRKLAWNLLRDCALATGRPLAPAACGRPRGYYIWIDRRVGAP
jgi:hypothetical protein